MISQKIMILFPKAESKIISKVGVRDRAQAAISLLSDIAAWSEQGSKKN